ncbi:MAG: pentapeptide repeat-containing protein, partial [Thermodesulfobacteriota bacterium]
MKVKTVLFYFAILVFTALSFIAYDNKGEGASSEAPAALTENDFSADPVVVATPGEGVVITFLEPPSSKDEKSDTGEIGTDIIPFKYTKTLSQTFCWQDDNEEAEHFMTLVDSNGAEALSVNANGGCITGLIEAGDYEMRIQHDGKSEDRYAIFVIPGEGDEVSLKTEEAEVALQNIQTQLNTNKCVGCDLSGVDLSEAHLIDVDLSGADLREANLSGVDLSGADLTHADLSGAILTNAILIDVDLTGANLVGANLKGADLSGSKLKNADLTGADQSESLLSNADLSGADLTGANLTGTDLTNANLSGTNTGNAIGFAVRRLQEKPILAQDEASEACKNGKLNPGNGEDIVITAPCSVGGGNYQYGNINILKDGSLDFDDKNIDFWAKSILVENGGSLTAGTPQTPIGTQNGQITIHLYGTNDGKGIECKSPLVNSVPCGIDKAVWDSNGKNKVSLPGGVTDFFYQYMDHDNMNETGFFGQKVLAVSYGGTLRLFGKKGATYTNVDSSNSGTSWVRLAKTLNPGDDTLVLDRAVDWQKNDRIVVTTTDYLPGHSEQLTIDNVSSDGKTINVKEKILYIHNGQTYPLSSVPQRLNLDFKEVETRAAVALLTRSIRIVSADNFDQGLQNCDYDCFPLAKGFFGSHTMVRQGVKEFKVQGVEFFQLGQ